MERKDVGEACAYVGARVKDFLDGLAPADLFSKVQVSEGPFRFPPSRAAREAKCDDDALTFGSCTKFVLSAVLPTMCSEDLQVSCRRCQSRCQQVLHLSDVSNCKRNEAGEHYQKIVTIRSSLLLIARMSSESVVFVLLCVWSKASQVLVQGYAAFFLFGPVRSASK